MNRDPASLANLHDIIVPDPLPLWPPAPGWLWLLGILAAILMVALLRGLLRYQRNRYRREALAELRRLQTLGPEPQAINAAQQRQALAQLSILLKRTALTAYSRAEVAELTGPAWFAFLDERGGTRFSEGLGETLEQATYGAASASQAAAQRDPLFSEVRQWILHHAPAGEARGS